MAKARDRVADTAGNVRPYVERALKDERVRDDVKSALAAARDVYDELMGARGVAHVASRVATDKEIQEKLRSAIDDLRRAADRIQGKDAHKTRNTLLLVTGIALGALFNPVTGPATRKWLTDKVFGSSDDDFGYGGDSASSPQSPSGAGAESTSGAGAESTSSSDSTSSPETTQA